MNVVAITGRMVADAEMRQTTSGKSVCSFRVAVDGAKKDAPANFFDVTAWEHTAEFVTKYFHKGDMIAISGALQSRQYQDKSGSKRTAIEIVARDVSFCGSKTTHAEIAEPAKESSADEFKTIDENGEDLPF